MCMCVCGTMHVGKYAGKCACTSCFNHICDLCYLSLPTAKTIPVVMINSRVDYCHSNLFSTAEGDWYKLQRIQKCLGWVVLKAARFSQLFPVTYAL